MLWWTLRQLKSNNYQKRLKAIQKLRGSPDPRAVEPLISLILKEASDLIALEALKVLGEIGNDRAIEALIDALSNENLTKTAISVLGEIKERRAVDALIPLLDNWRYQYEVFQALMSIGDERAINLVCENLNKLTGGSLKLAKQLSDEVKHNGNRKIKEKVIQFLLKEFTSSGISYREIALKELQSLDWRPADDRQRVLVAIACSKFDEAAKFGQTAVEPLLQILKICVTGDPQNAKRIAKCIGDIRDKRAVETLVKILKEREHHSDLHEEIISALGQIGDPRVVPDILESLTLRITFRLRESPYAQSLLSRKQREEKKQREDASKRLEATTVKSIKNIGNSVLPELLKMNVQSSMTWERIWFQLVEEMADETAVNKLVQLTKSDGCSDLAVNALTKVLERNASRVALGDLCTLASLEDTIYDDTDIYDGNYLSGGKNIISCLKIRQLAQQELSKHK